MGFNVLRTVMDLGLAPAHGKGGGRHMEAVWGLQAAGSTNAAGPRHKPKYRGSDSQAGGVHHLL